MRSTRLFWGIAAAFVATAVSFGDSAVLAQKVTLKTAKKGAAATVAEEPSGKTAARAAQNASPQSVASAVDNDDNVDADSTSKKSEKKAVDAKKDVEISPEDAIINEETENVEKTASPTADPDAEVLTPIPTSPLAPMTDAQRDAKYPIVPAALQMTLEDLAPTKELRNVRVLKAMSRIPRAAFTTKEFRDYAYQDAALPIGEAQTISPPFVVAYMTEALDPQPTDRVLEIGTGSGYQAAVLSCLVAEVYTIEIVKPLGRRAAQTLKKLEYSNVFVKLGDGYRGWAEAAPFDKIIVTCSPENIPQPLIDQLKEGGKMLIPIGERYEQYFVLCEKKNGRLEKKTLTPACFVPMTGEAEKRREIQPDSANPSLVGGDFEEANPTAFSVAPTATWKTDAVAGEDAEAKRAAELAVELPPRKPTPRGWYSTRNVYIETREDAPQGSSVCVCDNSAVVEEHRKKDVNAARIAAATLPELRQTTSEGWEDLKSRQREQETVCSMRQNFAVDGTKVKKLTLVGQARTTDLESKYGRKTVSLMKINFFDRDREPVGRETMVLAVAPGTSDWREFSKEIDVPRRAAEASLQVGILDGVGTVEFDALELKNKYEKKSKKK